MYYLLLTCFSRYCDLLYPPSRMYNIYMVCLLFVFLALQPIVFVFSQPGSGL